MPKTKLGTLNLSDMSTPLYLAIQLSYQYGAGSDFGDGLLPGIIEVPSQTFD